MQAVVLLRELADSGRTAALSHCHLHESAAMTEKAAYGLQHARRQRHARCSSGAQSDSSSFTTLDNKEP